MNNYSPTEEVSQDILGKWNINCTLFTDKAKLTGELKVSKSELIFQTKSTDDYTSILELISRSLIGKDAPSQNVAINIYRQWLKNNLFVIPKSEIQSILEISSLFNKQIVLNLSDSSTVTFNNGFSGVKQLYQAISK